jgi:poly-gamma-glutamate synthesis protein (capsule biosynthesis protein)
LNANKTEKGYRIFFTVLSVMILGVFVFFAAYTVYYGNSPAGEKIERDAVLHSPDPTFAPIMPESSESFESFEPPESSEYLEPEESPEPLEPPEPEEPDELRITFTGTGDNVVHPLLWIDAERRAVPGGRKYDFKPKYSDVADIIANADIAFINQEAMMAGSGFPLAGYPLFNAPQELAHDLIELGFDVMNIANNHMIDTGETGLVNTINFLRSLDVLLIGDYLNRDELYEIKVIKRGGIRIAFLAYTYSTNGLRLPASSEVVIPYYNNDELIISQIARAKEVSDAVIVSMHWGDEDVFTPNANQRRLAQLMADHGVLAIIGHHPHVLQPIEWIAGSGGNRTLCVYSLGNLANGMIRPKNMVGGFICFDIVKRGDIITLENPILTPTIYYYAQNWFNGHIYLLEDYTEELALTHGTRTRHGFTRTVADLWKYVTDNISAEFLKER